MNLEYSKGTVPRAYKCSSCGAKHVKLWRQYMTLSDHLSLFCARCAALGTKTDISNINKNGRRKCELGWTSEIGNLVPAIPTDRGDTYWGHTSTPPEAINWWENLQTLSNLA